MSILIGVTVAMFSNNRYIKACNDLLTAMEAELAGLPRGGSSIADYGKAMGLIGASIDELHELGRKLMVSREGEIAFFRDIWPRCYGRFFFYLKCRDFEVERMAMPGEMLPALIRREERRVARFFSEHREFWLCYMTGAGVGDAQFTREYSRACMVDPLCLVLDRERATLASYLAAWGVAYGEYLGFLKRNLDRALRPETPEGVENDYTWAPADADFVEWLYGLHSVGAIRYKGEVADMSRLQRWSKWALRKEVVNIYDRFKVLRNRKKERMAFTKRTASALERKINEAEGNTNRRG